MPNWSPETLATKTAQRHNLEAGVGHHSFVASGKKANPSHPGEVSHTITKPLATNLIVAASTDVQNLNKTERAYYNWLQSLHLPYIGVQNITLKLADDCRYTCDFNFLDANGRLVFHEVKGFFRDDAKIKIKVAARMYPLFTFYIVRRNKTMWDVEEVKP